MKYLDNTTTREVYNSINSIQLYFCAVEFRKRFVYAYNPNTTKFYIF